MNNRYFNPIKYVERFYWTFKETLDPLGNKESYAISNTDILTIANTLITNGYSTALIASSVWAKPEYSKVLDLICKRFWDHYCFYTLAPEFSVDERNKFIAKLLNVLEMTSPRYLKLLEVYTGADASLMSPVEVSTSGITRFNDTPQDEGNFANDEHTTNLTEDSRTTSNDLDTKMGRIREIESSYNNLLLNWSNEFEGLFIEEANL